MENITVKTGINILDKTDKSLAPMPSGGGVPKRSKFEWSTGGCEGTFEWIDKNDLNIDGHYQRDQCSEAKVKTIARDWDWLLCGAISVIRRHDGTLWVFDGGHRTRASFYRDDISVLPCLIHYADNVNDEAKAFVARNTMLTGVAAFDRFRASVVAGEPIAIKVGELLQEFNLTAVKGGFTTKGYISCIGAISEIVSSNFEDAKKVLEFCIEIAGEHNVVGRVLLAVFTLHQHFKSDFDILDRYADKLRMHSQKEIELRINQFTAECGGKGGHVIHAKAILELVNHKKRVKYQW